MTSNVNLLRTRVECLIVKASLEGELDGYQNRDQNLAYQDRRDDRTDATVTTSLATATGRVTYLNEQLARPGLGADDRTRYEDQLLTATYQQARLTRRAAAAEGGPAAFLAEVDADQIDAQVAILTAAIAAVQARHDALPA